MTGQAWYQVTLYHGLWRASKVSRVTGRAWNPVEEGEAYELHGRRVSGWRQTGPAYSLRSQPRTRSQMSMWGDHTSAEVAGSRRIAATELAHCPGSLRGAAKVGGKARARSVYDKTNAPLGGKENKFEGMMLSCERPSAIAYAAKIIHYLG
jgi:hypothetical protein